jgi:cysteine desulfurase / selenocysteine lyase
VRGCGWSSERSAAGIATGTILVGASAPECDVPIIPNPVRVSIDFSPVLEREFAGVAGAGFLNVASFGPLPERSRRAVQRMADLRARPQALPEPELGALLHRARAAAARLIGADAGEIALASSTSHGINVAARGLPLERGSTVLISDREFPANVYPWMALGERGVRLEIVPTGAGGLPDEDRMLERLGRGDVSCVALSSVQFATGFRMDLEAFARECREHGAFLVVDAIQSVGCIPVDVRATGIDVLATAGHKWLLSPFGTGFVYVRRELQERLSPTFVGWGGLEASTDLTQVLDYRLDFHADARRYEGGTPPFEALAGFAESLELLSEVGPDHILARVGMLLAPLFDWLELRPELLGSEPTPRRRSGIVAIAPPDPDRLHAALTRSGLTCALRENAVRIAAHLFNTPEEIGRVLDVLEEEVG